MKLSEAQFQSQIWDVARTFGWRAAHFPPSRNPRGGHMTAFAYNGKGWPDLVLCHPDRGLFVIAELKVKPNKPTLDQQRWIAALVAAGVDAQVWYPEDWPHIVDLLSNGAVKAS